MREVAPLTCLHFPVRRFVFLIPVKTRMVPMVLKKKPEAQAGEVCENLPLHPTYFSLYATLSHAISLSTEIRLT